MWQLFLYLHVLSAVLMGIYLSLPFLAARVEALPTGEGRFGFLNVLFSLNRAAQLALVISFLTGGYLAGKADYSVTWMILAVALLLAIGALSGILGKRMRLALADPSGSKIKEQIGSIRTLSTITAVLYLLEVTIMVFPYLF